MGAGSCCLPLPSKVAGKIRGNFLRKLEKHSEKMVQCTKSWTPADPLQLSEQLQLRSLLSPVDFI